MTRLESEERDHRLWDRLDRILRSRTARVVGLLLGLAALGFLVLALARADGAWRTITGFGARGVVLTLVGWLGLEAGAIALLRSIGSPAPGRVWASAQLIKYLPLPGSAAVGMVGSAVQQGAAVGAAFKAMVRHAVVLIGGALIVGSFSVAQWTDQMWGWGTWLAGFSLIGLGVSVVLVASVSRSLWGGMSLVLVSTITWFVAGGLVGAGLSSTSLRSTALIASAVAAGWVAGQITVPVPAGIGVREWATFVLLEPAFGTQQAAAIALVSRVLHVLADAIIIAVLVPPVRRGSRRLIGSSTDRGESVRGTRHEDGSDVQTNG